MPIEYKTDILKALKEKGYTTTRLRSEKLIGEATIQRLRHNKSVSFEVLAKLCDLLECEINDILIKTKTLDKVESFDEDNESTLNETIIKEGE